MNGWGPKSSVCPSKPGKSNFFGGISRDFAGISQRCPKSLRRKKSLCSIFVPYNSFGTDGTSHDVSGKYTCVKNLSSGRFDLDQFKRGFKTGALCLQNGRFCFASLVALYRAMRLRFADSNRAMPTARETSKTQTLRNTAPFFFPHFSLLVVRNWS